MEWASHGKPSVLGTSSGVVAGLVVTALVNSSSATTGLVVAMGASKLIDLPSAIGLIYGANIGSCVTGFLASLRGPGG